MLHCVRNGHSKLSEVSRFCIQLFAALHDGGLRSRSWPVTVSGVRASVFFQAHWHSRGVRCLGLGPRRPRVRAANCSFLLLLNQMVTRCDFYLEAEVFSTRQARCVSFWSFASKVVWSPQRSAGSCHCSHASLSTDDRTRGQLQRYLERSGLFEENDALALFRQLLGSSAFCFLLSAALCFRRTGPLLFASGAIDFLHQRRIVHRDTWIRWHAFVTCTTTFS